MKRVIESGDAIQSDFVQVQVNEEMDRPSPSLGPGASPPLASSGSSLPMSSFLGGPPAQTLTPYHHHTTSMAIRHEIQRFESVHPSIYAIYDLIELVNDPLLAQQIREHVVCIEDSFVNSQEWTLSRAVPDIRLGIVGSLSSGKSALVHRYLTGSYMQEESPEGGRFKKEIVVDGHSYLLLIRDEGGPPELQFTAWVDAVIFVFSLENEASFNAIYNYYAKMSQYRNMQEIPLILVGTQDAISENQPRVIDDSRARKLANDLKRCSYYETCATYGLNVERVFQDACQKLCQTRASRPTTPNHHAHYPRPPPPTSCYPPYMASPTSNGYTPSSGPAPPSPGFNHHSPAHMGGVAVLPPVYQKENRPPPLHMTPSNSYHQTMYHSQFDDFATVKVRSGAIAVPPPTAPPLGSSNTGTLGSASSAASLGSTTESNKFAIPSCDTKTFATSGNHNKEDKENNKEGPTPSSTPTTSRKNRRRSNLFTPSKKADEPSSGAKSSTQPEMGSGRSIPTRQGILYKKSNKSFKKEWKKKYVTLCDDGRMTYHPSLNDYMTNVHGKEIPLQYVTVKVPGQKPRGSRTIPQTNPHNMSTVSADGTGQLAFRTSTSTDLRKGEKVTLTGYELLRDPSGGEENNNADNIEKSIVSTEKVAESTTPNVKKRHHHRRMKSNGVKTSSGTAGSGNSGGDGDDPDGGFEFHIVSLDNKQWHFEASSAEERDDWVAAIEQQILNSLQGNESSKAKSGSSTSMMDLQAIRTLKSDISGNTKCVDCDAPNPDWASINLGVLMCIECSGVHRKLGSHISRVRSLDLDEWPPGHLAVMSSLGNEVANSIWESSLHHKRGYRKPEPNSSQEEKERFIMAKYNQKEFLASLTPGLSISASLVDAICRSDMKSVALVLAHANQEEVNTSVSPRDSRTPLHLAASLGNLAMAQMLIWSNANVKIIDHDGRSCVSYARSSGVSELIELLLNNGCPDVSFSGTLPRRKNSVSRKNDLHAEKVTSSVL